MSPLIKVKKTHPDAVLPTANNKEWGTGDTGFDLVAVEKRNIPPGKSTVVPVGLTLADITPGYWLRIEPRSGLGFKSSIQPHLGVIDNGYRGDLGVKLYNFGAERYFQVKPGDKIAQLVVYRLHQPVFEFSDEVTETSRGEKGFGSSDIKDLTRPPFSRSESACDNTTTIHISQEADDWYYDNAYKVDQGDSGLPQFSNAEEFIEYAKKTNMPDDIFEEYLGAKVWQ